MSTDEQTEPATGHGYLEELSPTKREYLARFVSHFPDDPSAPDDYVILKGHLLLQHLFEKIADMAFKQPEALSDQRLGFAQHAALAQATVGADVPAWIWVAAKKLNAARIELAHSLEAPKLEKLIRTFVEYVELHRPPIIPAVTIDLRLKLAIPALYFAIVDSVSEQLWASLLARALADRFRGVKTLADFCNLGNEPAAK